MKQTMHNIRVRWVLGILIALTLAFIWGNSMQSRAVSGGMSGSLKTWLEQLLHTEISEFLLRKAAHFLEFAVLGILLTGTFHGARNFTLAKPMLFAVLTAMTDETIQAFTPGRNCALSDVWLDAAGALTGAVLLWLIFKLRKK